MKFLKQFFAAFIFLAFAGNISAVPQKDLDHSAFKKICSKISGAIKTGTSFVKNNPKKCMAITVAAIAILYWFYWPTPSPLKASQSEFREEQSEKQETHSKKQDAQSEEWKKWAEERDDAYFKPFAECPANKELEEALLNLYKNRAHIKHYPLNNAQKECFYHDIAMQIQKYCNNDSGFLIPEEIEYLYQNSNDIVKSALDIFELNAKRYCENDNTDNFYSDDQSNKQPKQPINTIPESMQALTSKFIEQLTQNGATPQKEFHHLAKRYHPDQCKLTKKECNENMKALNLAYESLTKQN